MPKKIVLAANSSWYLFNFRAGTLKAFLARGCHVICLAPRDAFSERLVNEVGVDFVELDISGPPGNLAKELAALINTFRLVREIKPDYVFNFTIKANIYSGIACHFGGTRYANNVSGLGTAFLHESLLYRWLRRAYVWANKRADHVFFQNPEDHKLFRNLGLNDDSKVTVIPGSGVDLQKFTYRELPGLPLKFVMIGRLLGDKGVREYVEAARRIKTTCRDIKFVLGGPAGSDNATAIKSEEITKWLAEGHVDYRGEMLDVRTVLSEAHVFVLPSYREGMPRTVLEAAAIGRPAIVSDVPGCTHAIIPEQTGWLCKPRDVDSLEKAMRQVLSFDLSRLKEAGVAARQLAEERFCESNVVSAYIDRID